jgi:hypothetical protein
MLVTKRSSFIAISTSAMLLYLLLHLTLYSYFRNTLDFSYNDNANVKESHKQAKFLHITDLHVSEMAQYDVDYAKYFSIKAVIIVGGPLLY